MSDGEFQLPGTRAGARMRRRLSRRELLSGGARLSAGAGAAWLLAACSNGGPVRPRPIISPSRLISEPQPPPGPRLFLWWRPPRCQNGWAQYSTGRLLPFLTIASYGEIGAGASIASPLPATFG